VSFNDRISFPRAVLWTAIVFVLMLFVFAVSGPLFTWGQAPPPPLEEVR